MHVFLYFPGDRQVMIVPHTFDFFAQLLKNMLRKFQQLKDWIAAKLVTSIAHNIFRFDIFFRSFTEYAKKNKKLQLGTLTL